MPCWTSDTGADTILTDNPIIPVSVLYSLLGFNANVKLTDLIVIIFLITDRMFAVTKKTKKLFFFSLLVCISRPWPPITIMLLV